MMILRKILGVTATTIALGLPAFGGEVTVFAAASLKTALDEVIAQEQLNAVAVYGGSAAMARQIAQGAEADIVILAHRDWMEWLETQSVLAPNAICDLMGNKLVLAGAVDADEFTPESSEELVAALQGGRLAVGQLETVPAGQYAGAYLQGQGWLDALRPHLAQTSNVRLALALVARGEAPLGFIYASDIAAQPNVRAVFQPEADSYPEIRYPMAMVGDGRAETRVVWNALNAATQTFEKNGFSVLHSDDPRRCKAQ